MRPTPEPRPVPFKPLMALSPLIALRPLMALSPLIADSPLIAASAGSSAGCESAGASASTGAVHPLAHMATATAALPTHPNRTTSGAIAKALPGAAHEIVNDCAHCAQHIQGHSVVLRCFVVATRSTSRW